MFVGCRSSAGIIASVSLVVMRLSRINTPRSGVVFLCIHSCMCLLVAVGLKCGFVLF